MGKHIVSGHFQSDKYPDTPPDIVPIKVDDPRAQDLLWELAERMRPDDGEFADDLQIILRLNGYVPATKSGVADMTIGEVMSRTNDAVDTAVTHGKRIFGNLVKAGGEWVGRGGKSKE